MSHKDESTIQRAKSISRRTFVKRTAGTALIFGLGSMITAYGSVPTGYHTGTSGNCDNGGCQCWSYTYSGCKAELSGTCTYHVRQDSNGTQQWWSNTGCKSQFK